MTWLAWRQFRTQTLVTVGGLALLALYLVYLGNDIRDFYDTRVVNCAPQDCTLALDTFRDDYLDTVMTLGLVLIVLPAIIGIFWGAPLVARELEERTDRLVWNQSVTRTRWLAVKLGVVGLATAVVTGLFSLLLTWAASRYDQVFGERFAAMTFDSRNIVPVGYGLFAFALGTVVGMLVRRTVPAMAVTLAVFAALQVVVPVAVRQHLMPPVTTTGTLDAAVFAQRIGLNLNDRGAFLRGYTVPGAWMLDEEFQLFKPDGTPYTEKDARPCMGAGSREETQACTIAQKLTFEMSYHPRDRYWTFQWIELSGFLVLTALLTGFGFYWLRRRV
jgi:ABC-type transport system involved in multi-copper enzyme maturation permease subunit